MDTNTPNLAALFRQLGLPDDAAAIEAFIATHCPLANGQALCDAEIWTPSQAQFLREAVELDANWADVVENLAVRLS